jgi:tetraacyldisaccharide 4'-kinase
VLSRGYGGSREHEGGLVSDGTSVILSPVEAGDEPYLLACSLPGLVVAVGADRYRSGLLAIERCNPDIFILDDGFQHLRLERDLNILLLDGGRPFANGATLPAGLLREPVAAARRADLVLFTRCGDGEPPAVLPGIPFCRSRHRLAGVRRPDAAPLEPVASLASQRVLAFAGIADPAAFFAALAAEGVDPVETLALPDHVAYGEPEIATLCRLRDASGATCLVTTEKDGVKLGPWLHRLGMLYVTVLQLEIDDDGPLRAALEKLL